MKGEKKLSFDKKTECLCCCCFVAPPPLFIINNKLIILFNFVIINGTDKMIVVRRLSIIKVGKNNAKRLKAKA